MSCLRLWKFHSSMSCTCHVLKPVALVKPAQALPWLRARVASMFSGTGLRRRVLRTSTSKLNITGEDRISSLLPTFLTYEDRVYEILHVHPEEAHAQAPVRHAPVNKVRVLEEVANERGADEVRVIEERQIQVHVEADSDVDLAVGQIADLGGLTKAVGLRRAKQS